MAGYAPPANTAPMSGPTQKSQRCTSAQLPAKSAGAGASGRIDGQIRDGKSSHGNQRQAEADGDWREAFRCATVRRAENNEQM